MRRISIKKRTNCDFQKFKNIKIKKKVEKRAKKVVKQIFNDDTLDFSGNGVNRKMINFREKSSESIGNQFLSRIMKILEKSDEQLTSHSG